MLTSADIEHKCFTERMLILHFLAKFTFHTMSDACAEKLICHWASKSVFVCLAFVVIQFLVVGRPLSPNGGGKMVVLLLPSFSLVMGSAILLRTRTITGIYLRSVKLAQNDSRDIMGKVEAEKSSRLKASTDREENSIGLIIVDFKVQPTIACRKFENLHSSSIIAMAFTVWTATRANLDLHCLLYAIEQEHQVQQSQTLLFMQQPARICHC
ncbi:hypothetical protein VNO77_00062 [Canavalia gladiata]|uniref:Uncharacterized protein n=1 Tax=Canavalia gladiata TaxID=3824 RepID=A0AAN9MPE1_CANGL